MDSRKNDVFVALNIMLNSFARQCGYTFDVADDCEHERVRYTFTCRIGHPHYNYAHVVSYGELLAGHVYALMEYITGKVEIAFDGLARRKSRGRLEGQNYVDTDIAHTRHLAVIAKEVLNGEWGIGNARKVALAKAGYDPNEVQQIVNQMVFVSARGSGKSLMTFGQLAKATIKLVPEIKDVIFKDPATIVFWSDGTKTVVRTQEGDIYDPEKGLAMAICKKRGGNKWDYYNTFKHWLKKYKPESGDVETVTHITKTIKEDNNG